MDDAATCGKGLAANAVLPATLAEVVGALSAVLAAHLPSLDLQDESSRREHVAYSELVAAYDDIAALLRASAERMRAFRDLPMGRHDVRAMAASEPVEAFTRFVNAEQQLLASLQAALPDHQAMLAEMKQTAAGNP